MKERKMQEISDYIATIVILIIAMTLIELLLPNHKNKKYVMFAGTLIVLMSVIHPILKVFGSDLDITSKVKEFQAEMNKIEIGKAEEYQVANQMQGTYQTLLITNMKERLEEIGYEVLEVEIKVDELTYEPQKIEMRVRYQDGYIQPIVIDVFGNLEQESFLDADCVKIKEILSETYGVKKENIMINGK